MPAKQKRSDVRQVRIPVALHAEFYDFFSKLKLEILKKAALRASARGAVSGDFVLAKDDLIAVAQEAFPDAAAGLKKALSRREPRYVRRAS